MADIITDAEIVDFDKIFNLSKIGNSRFMVVSNSGSGNSTTMVSEKEKIRLQNTLIDTGRVQQFLNLLYGMGEYKIEVQLSNRKTSHRWGTAWQYKRKVILYRHTVWTFLHEVGHILTDNKAKCHGYKFGESLKMCYELWMEYIETNKTIPGIKPPEREYKMAATGPDPDRNYVAGGSFSIGDEVWFTARDGRHIEGTVIKINRKTCGVQTETGKWRVSPMLLNKYIGE